ncbi:MAG TPA: hypothetical protein VFP20_08730 [Bacteroidales bacterium]|nr:hypothetical protein [Bacteroidales bacterium]
MIENEYTPEESNAIARLIWHLINRNKTVNRKEADYFTKTLQLFKIPRTDFDQSLSTPIDEAYSIVRHMPSLKRHECGKLLRLAVTSDEVIELAELSMLNDILEEAAIFRPDRKTQKKSEGGF